jgi:hypothetical protein
VVSGCGQDIGDDLGLEHPMVLVIHMSVAHFRHPFSSRGGGGRPNSEIKSCLNSSQQERFYWAYFALDLFLKYNTFVMFIYITQEFIYFFQVM